jgi:hypothetical protein
VTTGETIGIIVSIITPVASVMWFSGKLTEKVNAQGVTQGEHGGLLIDHGRRIAWHDRRLDRIDERCGIHHNDVVGEGPEEEHS